MKANKNSIAGRVSLNVLTYFFAICFIFPLLLMFMNTFKTRGEIAESALAFPESFNLDNYIEIITDNAFVSSFATSILVVVLTTGFTVIIAAMTGYSLARWKSQVSNILTTVIMSTLFVPFQVYMISLIVVVSSIGLTGNILGLILVYIALGMPVPIFLFRSSISTFPKEIEEAAVVDGCSKARLFFQIVFPLQKPMIATVTVLNALWVWGEFLVAFLVYGNHRPMTLPLSQQYFYSTYTNQWNLILTGFVISSLPIIIFYIAMQKYIIKGVLAGAVKG